MLQAANVEATTLFRNGGGVSPGDIIKEEFFLLVRQALEQEYISLGRAAEILGLHREEMRKYAREWVG